MTTNETNDQNSFILVRLTKKFADRIFHEFNNEHPHQTAQGGELLVTGERIAKAARTPAVLSAIMQGVLEEVRDPKAVASPEPPDVLDTLVGRATPGATPGGDLPEGA